MTKKTILVVDDEEIIRKTISKDLREEGYGVMTSENGESAIAKMKHHTFSMVITDLMMKGLDGIQVLKHAKNVDPGIPVIILTGFGDINSAIDAIRLGADDYLLKPSDIDDLLFRMSQCFEKQELKKKIKLYENILPICSVCKKIRDDTGKEHGKGDWINVEEYFTLKNGIAFSHGYCKQCHEKAMKDLHSITGTKRK